MTVYVEVVAVQHVSMKVVLAVDVALSHMLLEYIPGFEAMLAIYTLVTLLLSAALGLRSRSAQPSRHV